MAKENVAWYEGEWVINKSKLLSQRRDRKSVTSSAMTLKHLMQDIGLTWSSLFLAMDFEQSICIVFSMCTGTGWHGHYFVSFRPMNHLIGSLSNCGVFWLDNCQIVISFCRTLMFFPCARAQSKLHSKYVYRQRQVCSCSGWIVC